MPIKHKKSFHKNGPPNESSNWDESEGAAPGESPDARIRRMSMQMASAERSGFRGERSDLYGGLPVAVVWAIRLAVTAGVVAALVAMISLSRGGGSSEEESSTEEKEAIAALIRAASERPEDASSTLQPLIKDDFQWISTADESFSPFRETVLAFFEASTPVERQTFVIPTLDVEKRLRNFADDALFDQISTPTFANNYCTGEGWMTVDVLLPAFGFRPVIIKTSERENLIDLDAFLGYNSKTSYEIKNDLENGQQVTFRCLAALSGNQAETPGDLLLALREPNDTLLLGEQILAQLSKFGSTPEHVIGWLNNGQPLPFTVTVTPEISLTGESALRISEIKADAWSSGLTQFPVALAPPSKTPETNDK